MDSNSLHPSNILYENRILFLFGEVNQEMAATIIPLLLVMGSTSKEPIKLYINSPGGEISSGLAIYDTMKFIKVPIHTICIGRAASMAAWLLCAGTKGHRYASENAQIMIHQGRTVMGGTFSDLKISMDEFTRTQNKMVQIFARHTGQDHQAINEAIERDRWMSADEAKEFGIIDQVVETTEA